MSDWKDEVTITLEGEYVQVLSDGDKSFERAEWLWANIADTCRESECFNVLGISQSTVPVQVLEGYDHGRLFNQVGITDEYRIAWVEQNREAFDTFRFIETVLLNRGFNVRLFSDAAEAKAWILDGEEVDPI